MRLLELRWLGVIICLLLQISSSFGFTGNVAGYTLARGKRSGGVTLPAPYCDQEVVEDLIQNVNETCSYVSVIDAHVANVVSRDPLPVPTVDDDLELKHIFDTYNNDLVTAKRNCYSWRKGDSILDTIRGLIMAAKAFELEFKNEFEENRARLEHIAGNHEYIGRIENEISLLEKSIAELKEATKSSLPPSVKKAIESIIKRNEEEVSRIMNDLQVLEARSEIQELLKYLKSVRDGAAGIEAKADVARALISLFRDSIAKDANAFKRARKHSKIGIKRLNQEKQAIDQERDSIQRKIDHIQARAKDERVLVPVHYGKPHGLVDYSPEMFMGEREVHRGIPFSGYGFKGLGISRLFDFVEPRLNRRLKDRRVVLDNRAGFMLIELNAEHMDSLHRKMATHMSRSLQLHKKLNLFNILDANLQSIESEVSSLLPTAALAISGVDQMRIIFAGITGDLDDIIERAKLYKTKAVENDIFYFIYNQLDKLKCQWDQAHAKIALVEHCN